MVARKRIAVVATAAIASVVMYGGLTTPKGTENEPVASTTVTESVHKREISLAPVVPLVPQVGAEPKKAETVEIAKKVEKHEVKAAEVVKKDVSDIVPPSHETIAAVLEKYIEMHHGKAVSRDKLLKYISWADTYTQDTEIDPLWILAMMWQESRFLEKSKSSHGAIGLLQILPSTAKSFGVSPSELNDPETNIDTSIKYLSYLLDRYDGNLRTTTIAYNQGEGNVARGKARSWYYTSVKKHYDKMARMLEEARQDR
ncbi:lytic transglycosylase domain-containing protein [Brevibacillus laterosporus]|uniref:lytic transglycosylase domain-containing protein n=1 Tax=Brevibacillus laterosporus TaxID=1465 RepID=UPI00036926FA|nr:lytic transglycosylase domain-containing protein [Brevibacillus laterosporus]ATO48525.1 hypothetical protein BrL25_05010 [Brevibacillus laterosporus DSM 25]MED2002358.1 lytic transglycosylase domain-containing protein [Brevibacillus laterosporus]